MGGKLTEFGLVPKIVVRKRAGDKFRAWTDLAVGEVSAFGIVNDLYRNDKFMGVEVVDAFLPKQVCGAADTVVEGEMVAECMDQAVAAGYQDHQLRFWFHSHVNMGVFWSGQDAKNMELLSRDANIISMVMNKKDERKGRIDIKYPFHITYDDVDIETESSLVNVVGLKELKKSAEMLGRNVRVNTSVSGIQAVLAEIDQNIDQAEEINKRAGQEYDALKEAMKAEFDAKVEDRNKVIVTPGASHGFNYGGWWDGEWNGLEDLEEWRARRAGNVGVQGQTILLAGAQGNKETKKEPDQEDGRILEGLSVSEGIFLVQESALPILEEVEKRYPKIKKFGLWGRLRFLIEKGLESLGDTASIGEFPPQGA